MKLHQYHLLLPIFTLVTLLSISVKAEIPTMVFPDDFSWKSIFDMGLRPKHVSPTLARINPTLDKAESNTGDDLPATQTASPTKTTPQLELLFPPAVTWKEVFDRGFRPKHVAGLERKKVECVEQDWVFRFRTKPGFPLDRGRLMFELQSDDSIRIINHIGRIPISMEEGERRLQMFHQIFSEELIKNGSVPPLMDKERGGVAALSDYYATAEYEGYTIHYGFTDSFQPNKPLLPEFLLALRHDMKATPLPVRRKTVEPPVGYEWYSLDPKVHTPDPVLVKSASTRGVEFPATQTASTPKTTTHVGWKWWLLFFPLLVIAVVFVRKIVIRNHS